MRRKHPAKEDLQYYSLSLGGYSYREIAGIFGVSVRTAWKGVQRARKAEAERAEAEQALADKVAAALVKEAEADPKKREPAWTRDRVPLFPLDSFTKESGCPHRGPLPVGSKFVCMVCHQSGMDHHPALRRDARADPKPEPAPTTVPILPEKKKDGGRKSEQWAPYAKNRGQSAA